MYTIYGIPNCDSVRKALAWFREHNLPYHFHDLKKSGITKKQLQGWTRQVGIELLLNRKSTTWRTLSESQQSHATSTKGAIELMLEQISLIKRPVIERAGIVVTVGFNEATFTDLFA